MKITLEFDGGIEDFERAIEEKDENFYLSDSIYWLLDYGEEDEVATHRTKYGDIAIRKETK